VDVKKVIFDWFYSHECGEDYSFYEVGKTKVMAITYHKPAGEGDRHYCEVYFSDGKKEIIFNINRIEVK
jgi:hypothetical protein